MNYAALIPLFPLIGFLIVGLFGRRINSEKLVGTIASSAILLSFITAAATFMGLVGLPEESRSFVTTISHGWLQARST